MYMMWYVVVMAALFAVTVALPFGLFYSETDEEKEFVSPLIHQFNTTLYIPIIFTLCLILEMAHLLSIQEWSHFASNLGSHCLPHVFLHELHVLPSDCIAVQSIRLHGCKYCSRYWRLCFKMCFRQWRNRSTSWISNFHTQPNGFRRMADALHIFANWNASYSIWLSSSVGSQTTTTWLTEIQLS